MSGGREGEETPKGVDGADKVASHCSGLLILSFLNSIYSPHSHGRCAPLLPFGVQGDGKGTKARWEICINTVAGFKVLGWHSQLNVKSVTIVSLGLS